MFTQCFKAKEGMVKMKNFLEMNTEELLNEKFRLEKEYEEFKKLNLTLNMARGVPSLEQISLSNDMLDIINSNSDFNNENGIDCRNYGGAPYGIPEARRLFAKLMGVYENDVIVGGNSSLQLMFDTVSIFMTHGASGCEPWLKQEKIKFLCPSPGYDRHFKICEYFNIEMIPIKMNPDGPDMDTVEELLLSDSSIKGIWCVPKFSNPQGITYSDETVKRLAALKPKAKDFRLFWDNAYSVHELTNENIPLLNIMNECQKNGNEHRPIIFCSFSKITFAGSAISAVACRGENLSSLKRKCLVQSVGPDKLNQLRHIRFLKNLSEVRAHMKRHQEILGPKFNIVLSILKKHFGDNPIAKWETPKGGYFISVDLTKGCGKRSVELCKEAGVILTEAGATYPYGYDPSDSNIRIAPSFPTCTELSTAMEIFAVAVKIAYLENVLKGS